MKKLLSLFIVLFWLTSFSYWVDSYTCSYKWIVNEVSNYYWSSTTYYFSNCNDLGGYYDCNVFADLSTLAWNCYQIWWFDLNYFQSVNLTLDYGANHINFSNYYNNLDQLNGYMVCSPSRFYFQGRVETYFPNWSYTITIFPESYLTNYSYTYNCPTCNTSSLENQLSSCQTTLSGCMSDLYNTENDLADAFDEIDYLSWELASCQNSSSCDYSWYILESEITTWYCETRFNMIEPSDCPNSSWSWEIMWSSFRVNNFQVMWWRNIYLYIPEWLDWSYTYVDENLQVEVENEGDEEYIQSVIDINSYRPTSEDFTSVFVSGLTLIMPYIVIVLFIIFIRKFIKKIFK